MSLILGYIAADVAATLIGGAVFILIMIYVFIHNHRR